MNRLLNFHSKAWWKGTYSSFITSCSQNFSFIPTEGNKHISCWQTNIFTLFWKVMITIFIYLKKNYKKLSSYNYITFYTRPWPLPVNTLKTWKYYSSIKGHIRVQLFLYSPNLYVSRLILILYCSTPTIRVLLQGSRSM